MAGRYLEQALVASESLFGRQSPERADTLDRLGILSNAKGDLDTAEKRFRTALGIPEIALGTGHTDVGMSLSNLALLHDMRGDHSRAITFNRQALTILEGADEEERAKPIRKRLSARVD